MRGTASLGSRMGASKARVAAAGLLVAGLAAALAAPATGQMVTGAAMEGFAKALGLEPPARDWSVQQLGCDLGANALWPGEKAVFTFLVKVAEPYRGKLVVHVVRYGTRGKPGDIWRPLVFRIADGESTELDVDLPAGGGTVQVTPRIGDAFGGYALVLELPRRGRAFGAACVRVPPAEPGKVWLPTYALDLPWPHEMSEQVYNVFYKLGVKGARVEGGYNTIADAHVDWALKNDLTLMLTVGCGNTPREQQPLGRGRPWLNPDNSMKERVKEDLAWLPSFDDEFRRYLKDVLCRHGWPKGPINAVELWNEPWEGVSISGWGADCLRYREIYLKMAQAVLDARKEAGVKVLIGGASSSTNTRDKLFCRGEADAETFLPILDFVSIHYQPLAADPALEPRWVNRAGEYGPVRCWDTESWVANSEDRVATVIASMRAMGQQRTAGIYHGNVYTSQKLRPGGRQGREYRVAQVWSPGAAVAACQRFIGQRAFREILFRNGLPWVFVFDGLPKKGPDGQRAGPADPDDGTLVVVGDLKVSYEPARTLFRSVALAADARMELPDGGGAFVLYDFYGNPLPARDGKIVVPLDGLGYFVRTDGSPGSFARLVAAVRSALVVGVEPVEIVAADMTDRIAARPKLTVRLTNVLNRPVAGRLSVKLDGCTVEPAEQTIALKPHETRQLAITVTGGRESESNDYPLLAAFDAGADGQVSHAEIMHVNLIARRTITLDGRLDDWKGAIPQTHARSVGGPSLTEKAYLPFRDFAGQTGDGQVAAYLASDDGFFYFAARVPGMDDLIRFETRDDDEYFYPEKVFDRGRELTWPAGVRRFSYRKDPDLPSGNGRRNVQIAFNVLPPEKKQLLPFPPGTMPRFCCYQDTDYEFALNKVAPQYGGGAEIFCLGRPGAPRKHFYPRQPKAPLDGGPVKGDARLIVLGNVVECAIPWNVIPEVDECRRAGSTVKFSFRVNNGPDAFELAAGRSVSKDNPLAFHNDWSRHWANEIAFGFEK